MTTDPGVLEQVGGVLGGDLGVLAVVAVVGAGAPSLPNPPAMTEMNDRFIAVHMM